MVFGLFTRNEVATEWRQFTLAGKIYSVQIRRRSNARKLTMRVRDRAIHLTIPVGTANSDMARFLSRNVAWIDAQIKAQDEAMADALPGSEGPVIYFQGKAMAVRLVRDDRHQARGKVEVANDALIIRVHSSSRMRPARVLEDWLRHLARKQIRAELDSILPSLDEDPVPLAIRDQKTRWGSCSTTRRLSFNWRLIMAPPESLRYVVVHEAAHLVHHDHSSRFWGLVEDMMPDYRQHQAWLRDHQVALFASVDHLLNGLRPEQAD